MSVVHWYDEDPGADLRQTGKWLLAGVAILGLHLGGVYVALHWTPAPSGDMPAAALMVELAPLPVAPPSEMEDVAPGPQMTQAPETVKDAPETPDEPAEAMPEPLKTQTLEELIPPPPPVALAEALLPPLPEERKAVEEPPPKPVENPKPKPKASRKPPAPVTSAAPRSDAAPSNAMAAPTSGAAASNSTAPATWHGMLMAHLNRHKRYPAEARAKREQGMAKLHFSIDRAGKVLSANLSSSSGSSILDSEVMDLIRRASPLPAPPPEVAGGVITLTVPVKFDAR